ncbi:hypothetical protein A8709_22180 [Paenibacillus pectinilyticus]|uniref:N-acetyltransferase domain-containing protein n=1 Tax=Paenibacillus pectinilyticus TaxID=512399 RepID=A0A1C0ZRB3_9BACL|nr:GNAT family N-acetyltransferase [Paenibacillus pectinilyticus]OCT10561.1 hypothetical protein A8709_22180 [Paenibacillus pectinilyticus]
MIEIRHVRPDEMEQAVRLSDETFRDAEQASMLKAFPSAFDARLYQSFGAFEGDELVAFMGLVPSVVQVETARMSVLSLGSVCTHPNYRGKKIASTMLRDVYAHAERAGASMLLVSGDGPLYMREGCHYFGSVSRFVVSASHEKMQSFKAKHGTVIRSIHAGDWFQLHAVAANRTVRYEQGVAELPILINSEAIASCYHMQHAVYASFESEQMTAYAIVAVPMEGRAMGEESPFVVEWGGDAVAVVSILAYALHAEKLEALEIPVVWHETKLLQALSIFPYKKMRNHGTVHIVNPERLFNELLPYLTGKAPAAAARLSLRQTLNGGAILLLDNREEATLHAEELVALFFDPQPKMNVPERLKDQLDQLFPVPFPHAGGLNFV